MTLCGNYRKAVSRKIPDNDMCMDNDERTVGIHAVGCYAYPCTMCTDVYIWWRHCLAEIISPQMQALHIYTCTAEPVLSGQANSLYIVIGGSTGQATKRGIEGISCVVAADNATQQCGSVNVQGPRQCIF